MNDLLQAARALELRQATRDFEAKTAVDLPAGMGDPRIIAEMLDDAEKDLRRHRYRQVLFTLEQLQKGREVEDKRLLRAIQPAVAAAIAAVEDADYNKGDINAEAGPWQKAVKAIDDAEKALTRAVRASTRTAASSLGKLKRAAPVFRKTLQDLYRENRGGSPKIVGAITEAGKKFNEVIDLLQVIEYEEQQEMREHFASRPGPHWNPWPQRPATLKGDLETLHELAQSDAVDSKAARALGLIWNMVANFALKDERKAPAALERAKKAYQTLSSEQATLVPRTIINLIHGL